MLDDNGYGPIALGLTEAQVAAIVPTFARSQLERGCTQFLAPPSGGPKYTIVVSDDRVVGVTAPAQALTSTGIRIGSTRAQIKAAYPTRKVSEQRGPGGPILLVDVGSSWLGFGLAANGTVASLSVGSYAFVSGYEICVGPSTT